MPWSSVALVVVLAGCASKAEDACKRLAPRLMPEPTQEFIDRCTAQYKDEEAVARTVDCLLAVEGDIYQPDLDRCAAKGRMPMYFQF
jgi:hypothetical protein